MAQKLYKTNRAYLFTVAAFEFEDLNIEALSETEFFIEFEKIIESTPFGLKQLVELYCLLAFALQKIGLSSDSVSQIIGVSSVRKFVRTKLFQIPELRQKLNFQV